MHCALCVKRVSFYVHKNYFLCSALMQTDKKTDFLFHFEKSPKIFKLIYLLNQLSDWVIEVSIDAYL